MSEIEEKKIRINPGKSRIIEYDLGDVIGIEKLRLVGFDKISDFIWNLTIWDSEKIMNEDNEVIFEPEIIIDKGDWFYVKNI